ncbi:hypothetical protein SAMN02910398_00404 [Butyrivibrio sp. YAB3001]|nr:hypothetical protein SAMN02910398_00404 [Butyrivibrio sp. YAB3001]
MGMGFMRKITVLVMATIITANMGTVKINTNDNLSKAQMMQISCHHCHENITVDISGDHAICEHCGENNIFAG